MNWTIGYFVIACLYFWWLIVDHLKDDDLTVKWALSGLIFAILWVLAIPTDIINKYKDYIIFKKKG